MFAYFWSLSEATYPRTITPKWLVRAQFERQKLYFILNYSPSQTLVNYLQFNLIISSLVYGWFLSLENYLVLKIHSSPTDVPSHTLTINWHILPQNLSSLNILNIWSFLKNRMGVIQSHQLVICSLFCFKGERLLSHFHGTF